MIRIQLIFDMCRILYVESKNNWVWHIYRDLLQLIRIMKNNGESVMEKICLVFLDFVINW